MSDPWPDKEPQESRRSTDRGAVAAAAKAAKDTSRTFWNWAEHHHIDALSVLVITLWLTVRVIDWALDYSYAQVAGTSGAERAGIIAAVMGPWGLAQAALFKFYAELKAKPAKEGLL